MHEYKVPLGDAIRNTRKALNLTQAAVAERAGIDVRTLIAIENYEGNPKMQVMYPLIRALEMDANLIYFHSSHSDGKPTLSRIHNLLSDCTEQEAELLYPIIETILTAMRTKETIPIE